MADQKDTRKVWTDAQKDALIYEVSRIPKGHSIQPVLDKYGVSDSAFRSMRRRHQMKKGAKDAKDVMKAKLDPLPLKDLPPAVPVAPLAKEDFRSVTKTRKLAMLAEYNRLPNGEKKAWREAHNASTTLITYHNLKHRKAKGVKDTSKHPPENLPALVAEYYALPHTGGFKSDWLKDHGLNHQNMFDYRKRVQLMGLNGSANLPAVRQPHIPPHVPIGPTPTLQDGVNYLEIKRDLFNEIISDLKRVLQGER